MSRQKTMEAVAEAVNNGRVIESGWIGGILAGVPDGVPEDQLYVMRFSFYRGAQFVMHLLNSVPDAPDDEMIERMCAMMNEMRAEMQTFMEEHARAKKNVKTH
jgi:hypothetical protein